MASERAAPRCVFVTGTDTGVGKTFVSATLLHAMARTHARVLGMKPVAAGLIKHEGRWVSEDVLALRAASTVAVPEDADQPVALPEPLSPHLAAARAGRRVTVAELLQAQARLVPLADAMVVEGAGGWRVPISADETLADFARALGAPVLLVVGLRLGCLNHALLSAEAIVRDGLPLLGWVANRVDPAMAGADDNLDYLRRQLAARFGAPLLADLPWSAAPDARQAAAHLPWPPACAPSEGLT
jgi:dethiobiotin synthetase